MSFYHLRTVAPLDSDRFETPLCGVQAQWGILRASRVNTGQLFDRKMELRGRKACDVFNKFVEEIFARSSDFRDPKMPIATKVSGVQPRVFALGGASRARSCRNESRMCDIYGMGTYTVNVVKAEKAPGFRESAGEALAGYDTKQQRPKLGIGALAADLIC